jgi:hypothetical protein
MFFKKVVSDMLEVELRRTVDAIAQAAPSDLASLDLKVELEIVR